MSNDKTREVLMDKSERHDLIALSPHYDDYLTWTTTKEMFELTEEEQEALKIKWCIEHGIPVMKQVVELPKKVIVPQELPDFRIELQGKQHHSGKTVILALLNRALKEAGFTDVTVICDNTPEAFERMDAAHLENIRNNTPEFFDRKIELIENSQRSECRPIREHR